VNKAFLPALLLIVSLLFVACPLIAAQSGTQVGGTIDSVVTWTASNSPYSLTSPVVVGYSGRLLIQPGVTVNLNSFNLQVNGYLIAQGASGSNIIFTSSGGNIALTATSASYDQQEGSGCIIAYATVTNAAILTSSTAPMICNDTISDVGNENGAITMQSGAPTITGNTITGGIQCIDDASPTITNNFIVGGISGSGEDESSPIIVGNVIESGSSLMVSGTGIYADGSNYYIANNTIFGCTTAISIDDGAPYIVGNLIINNTDAITLNGDPTSPAMTVLHNTICNNTVGLSLSYGTAGSTTIAYNNFVANGKYTLNGTLANNWWGTTNQAAIAQMLPNGATYLPILNSPDTQAPPVPSNLPSSPPSATPTPSPSPTPSPFVSTTPQTQNAVTNSGSPTATPTQQPTATATPNLSIPEITSIAAMAVLALSLAASLTLTARKHGK